MNHPDDLERRFRRFVDDLIVPKWLHEPEYDALWQLASDLDFPISVHGESRHVRAAFRRIAAMGEGGGLVQHCVEETLIGFELERVRLDTGCVRDHAVGGHDGETFNAIGAGHVRG